MKLAVALMALSLPLAGPTLANADPVTISLTFTMAAGIGNPADVFGAPMPPGTVFNGVYTYDSAMIDSNPDPRVGTYPTSAATVFGGSRVLQTNPSIFVSDLPTDHPLFRDLFTAQGQVVIPGFEPGQLFLHFVSPASTISTDRLPQTAEEFATFFPTGLLIIMANKIGEQADEFDTTTHEVLADISVAATPAPTPEPGSLVLIGTGLIGIVRATRRRG